MHPMLQESCDEAAACAQIEFDQEQQKLDQEKGLSAPTKTDTTTKEKETNHGLHCF